MIKALINAIIEYEELRKRMAKNFKEEFGPEQALQLPEQISAMDKFSI